MALSRESSSVYFVKKKGYFMEKCYFIDLNNDLIPKAEILQQFNSHFFGNFVLNCTSDFMIFGIPLTQLFSYKTFHSLYAPSCQEGLEIKWATPHSLDVTVII